MNQIESLLAGRCAAPDTVLGVQPRDAEAGTPCVVRVFITWAATVDLVLDDRTVAMDRVVDPGLFEAAVAEAPAGYRLRATDHHGSVYEIDDPYAHPPALREADVAGFLDGTDCRAQRYLGAQVVEHDGVPGTRFSVWAPRAHNVNLMGECNRWDPRCHPMRPLGGSGVWELFVPGIGSGTHYKYQVVDPAGRTAFEKADPFGRAMELRPNTASLVVGSEPYPWGDGGWMTGRGARQGPDAAIAIYEVHLGSWRRHPDADPAAGLPGWLTYRELAHELLPYVAEQGFSHVELLPVSEHPLDKSWGYQSVGYFAPTSRHGTPDDFRYFVDQAHRLGIGVVLDWVPAHFPRDAFSLAQFDGTPAFEHADPRRGAHPDWGTLVFDYGRPEVVSFLLSSALFWLESFHLDGLRVDAVASMLYLNYSRRDGEWVPNVHGGVENLEAVAFLRRLNDAVHHEAPGALMVAEESTSWPKVSHATSDGGLGFDLKWDMGWMNDVLTVMRADPVYRKALYDKLTFAIWYAASERFLLPLSHDEVVHLKGSLLGKMPGTREAKLANLRLLLSFMWAHPGKKLLFMGGELGQPSEWQHEGALEWDRLQSPGHRGVQSLVRALNRLYRDRRALRELDLDPRGFEWLDCHDPERTTIAFIRWARDFAEPIVVVANFTPVSWKDYQLPVPFAGRWTVLLNSAAPEFGADPPADLPESFVTTEGEIHSRKQHIVLDLPSLAAVFLAWEGGEP